MNYTSVPQIFEVIDETRARLYRRVEGLSDEQATTRPRPDAWTVAEIVEHLSLIEERLVKMMSMMLMKAESAGAGATAAAPIEMVPFSLDKYIERARDEKYDAPEAVRPSGAVTLSDSLAKLKRSRDALHSLRPRIEAIDLSTVTYPHPAFGPLNFYRWLAFIGIHEERHLKQAEAMLSS